LDNLFDAQNVRLLRLHDGWVAPQPSFDRSHEGIVITGGGHGFEWS
jgi:hypothetical protein